MSDWVYMGAERLPIWGEHIPYNTGRSKLEHLAPAAGVSAEQAMGDFCGLLVGNAAGRERICADTISYVCEIACGAASDRFDDVPFLAPFVCPGAKTAVLILPGGGCAYEEFNKEGTAVTRYLNDCGMSAFVLKYRCHPYSVFAALADTRRAVRWLRANAELFGLDPARVGTLGFSAGGFLTAAQICLERNDAQYTVGYRPDELDAIDDRPAFAGHIYPVTGIEHSPGMLYAMHGMKQPTADGLSSLLDALCLAGRVQPGDPPQFVCWGTEDTLIPPRGAIEYADALAGSGVEVVRCPVEKAGHGFGLLDGSSGSKPWQQLFAEWVGSL